jgi:hypothetical protein
MEMRSVVVVARDMSSTSRSTEVLSAVMRAARSWDWPVTSWVDRDTFSTRPSFFNSVSAASSLVAGIRNTSRAVPGTPSVVGCSVRPST